MTLTPKFEPIVLSSQPSDGPEEMVDLFSIDGRTFQVPARPRVNVALQGIDDLLEYGAGLAEILMLKRAIGQEAFTALSEFEGLTRDHLRQLGKAVTALTMGALEEEEGNPGN